jgi:hypothetical protein
MRPQDFAVDNASLGTAEDQHPCQGQHSPGPDGACVDCGHRHDWYFGECQDCGATHPEDCVGCAAIEVHRGDPSHSYEAPEEPDDRESEEPDGMYLAKVAIEDRMMGVWLE